jgi:tetratricopeptide (TPR) repeat protein
MSDLLHSQAMTWSPRIIVPILLALVLSIAIGSVFFVRIQDSIQFIERTIEQSQGSSRNTPLLSRMRGRGNGGGMKDLSKTLQSIQEGAIFESKGMMEKAEERYRDALKNGGGNDARVFLAHLLRKKGEREEAESIIEQSVGENGTSDDLLLEKGLLMLEKDPKQAEVMFQSLDATSAVRHYGLALVAMVRGDHITSEKELRTIQGANDDHWKKMGSVILNAYEEFALFEHGEDVHRDTLIARALAEVDECPTARKMVRTVLQKKDGYRDAWIVQGYCELMSGETKNALASLEKAYAIDPIKPEIQYFLARTYANLGDPQNAVTFLQYAIVNGFEPKNDAQKLLVEYAKELGNIDLAIENLELLLAHDLSPTLLQELTTLSISTPERAQKTLVFLETLREKQQQSVPLLVASIHCAEAAKEAETHAQLIDALELIDPKNTLLKKE